MKNIYSTQKILYHLDSLNKMKNSIPINPIQVHLMPNNSCNHNCSFCSYRIDSNKNNEKFDKISYIPENKMIELINDFKDMDVKAIELTGGGEALLYKYKDTMIDMIIKNNFDYSLVTNGTLITEELAKKIAPQMTWGRISLDAGTKETHSRIRNISNTQFNKALNGISLLRKYSENKEFKLGAGFVVTNENYKEIVEATKLAKEYGADNIRISAIFHPEGINYFKPGVINIATELAKLSEEFNDDVFNVYNLFNERIHNLSLGAQDYKYCGTKEILCVIGGDCNVYTCCSLAFNKRGLIGNIRHSSFKELWNSDEKINLFKNFDASKICTFGCLYESRNKVMNDILWTDALHKNFI